MRAGSGAAIVQAKRAGSHSAISAPRTREKHGRHSLSMMPLNYPSKREKSSKLNWKRAAGCGVQTHKEKGGGYGSLRLSISPKRNRLSGLHTSGTRARERLILVRKPLPSPAGWGTIISLRIAWERATFWWNFRERG